MTALRMTWFVITCSQRGCPQQHTGDVGQTRAVVRKILRGRGWTTQPAPGPLPAEDFCPAHKPLQQPWPHSYEPCPDVTCSVCLSCLPHTHHDAPARKEARSQ